ncbi:RNA 2',3'-cyclic phosphodiesterase [Planctomycetaceae bacterium]|nr:RNA 2',3'-cyclic phosphodiesterase [Planctomycetaceae bacterium]
MRTFVAIKLPGEVKELLRSIQSGLDRGFRGVSWVKAESIHLTLKFLGEIDEAKAREVSEALEKASSASGPFTLEVQGVGCFPNSRSPRVLWAGIKESAPLASLQKRVDGLLMEAGFEAEDRPFTPHLTLCRIKSPEDGRTLGKLLAGLKPEAKASFTVSSFAFMKSVLKPSGAEYTPIREFALTGANN